jgi:formamidopyrimidine-DNA glycosylase
LEIDYEPGWGLIIVPELPEVETIKNTLQPKLRGRKVSGIQIYLPRLIKYPSHIEFMSQIRGKEFQRITRRGKYLIFQLSDGYFLVIHLRMTGRLLYLPMDTPREKHTHIILQLDNPFQLRYHDLRTFGTLYLVGAEEMGQIKGLVGLGPEPLGKDFTVGYLEKNFSQRRIKLKSALLDQGLIAGLGNIYVDEGLFRAGLHPQREVSSLGNKELRRLHQALQDVLREGIEHRGTTIRDYLDGEGQAGGFQKKLLVYGRQGKPCPQCGSKLEKIRVGGRGTVFCPSCQKPFSPSN